MRRPLGAFERAQTLTDAYSPFNAVVVLRLAGAPSPALLRRALGVLQARHPLLRVRLVRHARGDAFETVADQPIPLETVEGRGEGGWRALAEEELNRPFDTSRGPLVRATFLRGEEAGAGDLVLTLQHAVMDAASGASLLRELLAVAAALAAGEALEPPPPEPELPPPAEARFPRHLRGPRRWLALGAFLLRQMGDELAFRLRGPGKVAPAPESSRCRILSWQLAPEATAALVRQARRRRVTLVSVLNAALLQVVARYRYPRRFAAGGQALRYITFADLRPYLEPPVPPEELGSFFAMLRFTVRLPPGGELWALAGRIHRQIYTAGRRGDKFLASLMSPYVMKALLAGGRQRMAAAALSYGGPLEIAAEGETRVLGFHAFVSNLNLGPEYTAQVRLSGGRLVWDILYLDGDMDRGTAEAMAADLEAVLLAASAGEGT